MKRFVSLFSEFAPVLVFFVCIEYFDLSFVVSTEIFIAVTVAALFVIFTIHKKISLFPILVCLLVVVFGLLTVFLNEPGFIIFQDTLYAALFAIILSFGLFRGKFYLEMLFRHLFLMSTEGWRILTIRWIWVFIAKAVTNEIFRIFYDERTWVAYKFYATIIVAIFALYQFNLSRKHRLPEANFWGVK